MQHGKNKAEHHTSRTASKTNDSAITLAKPLKAAKVFDYYTGALPEPQKGEPITLPLAGTAPIKAYSVYVS